MPFTKEYNQMYDIALVLLLQLKFVIFCLFCHVAARLVQLPVLFM